MYKQEKSDAILNIRCKSTTLATIAGYFMSQHRNIRSKSELVRSSLEFLEEVLVEENGAQKVTSLEQARNFLSRIGLGELNPGGRLGKTRLAEGEREASDDFVPTGDAVPEPQKTFNNLDPEQQLLVEKLKNERAG